MEIWQCFEICRFDSKPTVWDGSPVVSETITRTRSILHHYIIKWTGSSNVTSWECMKCVRQTHSASPTHSCFLINVSVLFCFWDHLWILFMLKLFFAQLIRSKWFTFSCRKKSGLFYTYWNKTQHSFYRQRHILVWVIASIFFSVKGRFGCIL